jgi:hypothetical protein
MKQAFCLLFQAFLFSSILSAQGFQIEVSSPSLENGIIQFSYLESNTVKLVSQLQLSGGKCSIKADSLLAPGLYQLVFPGGQRLELLLGKVQTIKVTCDTSAIISGSKVEGNSESADYHSYLQYTLQSHVQSIISQAKLKNKNAPVDSLNLWKHRVSAIDSMLVKQRESLLAKHQSEFLGDYMRALVQPENPSITSKTGNDSTQWSNAILYNRQHFWDNFRCENYYLICTPYFNKRLNFFFSSIVPRKADSLSFYAEKLLKTCSVQKKSYSKVLEMLIQSFDRSGPEYESAFVHLVNTYLLNENAKIWNTAKQKAARIQRGMPGADFPLVELCNFEEKKIQLKNIHAKYIVVLFWNSNQDESVDFNRNAHACYKQWKQKDIEVLAIHIAPPNKYWSTIIAQQVPQWLDVYNCSHNDFADLCNLQIVPSYFLLDGQFEILSKGTKLDKLKNEIDHLE